MGQTERPVGHLRRLDHLARLGIDLDQLVVLECGHPDLAERGVDRVRRVVGLGRLPDGLAGLGIDLREHAAGHARRPDSALAGGDRDRSLVDVGQLAGEGRDDEVVSVARDLGRAVVAAA